MLRLHLAQQQVHLAEQRNYPLLLLIEDDLLIIRTLKRILSNVCLIHTINKPRNIAPYCMSHVPALVITDSIGFSPLLQLQREGYWFPTMVYSGRHFDTQYAELEILGWYEKPTPLAEIQEQILAYLDMSVAYQLEDYESTRTTETN